MVCRMLLIASIFALVWVVVYQPITRVWNWAFPTYLTDPKTGEVFRLVVYHGYDKHSAVVAEVRPLGSKRNQLFGDHYFTLARSRKRPIPKGAKLRVLPGGKS